MYSVPEKLDDASHRWMLDHGRDYPLLTVRGGPPHMDSTLLFRV